MNKVLVIGASSFSGKHFCNYLENKGIEVYRGCLRTWNFPLDSSYTHVVNFAALNVVAPSWLYPEQYMNANVQSNLWTYLSKGPIEKYVHISTPEVYGSTGFRISEEAPFNPSTPYAVSRAAAEMMLRAYHKQYTFPVVFTRSCNVYGPGQQLYRMIPKILWSIKKGAKFPLEGSGMSHRAFIHIDDLCNAIFRVLEDGEPPYAYNISSNTLFRIRDILSIACHRMGVKLSEVVSYVQDRPGKDATYNLDIQRIRSLGWMEKGNLESGIDGVIRWINQNWSTLKDQSTDYEIKL